MKKLLVLLAMALLVFGACSEDDDATSSQSVTGASGSAVELDGTWGGTCNNDGDGGSGNSTLVASGTDLTNVREMWFATEDCVEPSDLSVDFTGSFVLGAEVDAAMGTETVTATKTDITVATFTWTPNSATAAGMLTAMSFCGLTDWADGTSVDMLSNTSCGFPDGGFLTLTYIDDSVTPNVWHMGIEESDGGTLDDDGYPTEVGEEGDARQ